jgi:hypothetical protein
MILFLNEKVYHVANELECYNYSVSGASSLKTTWKRPMVINDELKIAQNRYEISIFVFEEAITTGRFKVIFNEPAPIVYR